MQRRVLLYITLNVDVYRTNNCASKVRTPEDRQTSIHPHRRGALRFGVEQVAKRVTQLKAVSTEIRSNTVETPLAQTLYALDKHRLTPAFDNIQIQKTGSIRNDKKYTKDP
jgi:hypothetical protein